MPVKFQVTKMDLCRDGKSIWIDGLIKSANSTQKTKVLYDTKAKVFDTKDSVLGTIDLMEPVNKFFLETSDKEQKGFQVYF